MRAKGVTEKVRSFVTFLTDGLPKRLSLVVGSPLNNDKGLTRKRKIQEDCPGDKVWMLRRPAGRGS